MMVEISKVEDKEMMRKDNPTSNKKVVMRQTRRNIKKYEHYEQTASLQSHVICPYKKGADFWDKG